LRVRSGQRLQYGVHDRQQGTAEVTKLIAALDEVQREQLRERNWWQLPRSRRDALRQDVKGLPTERGVDEHEALRALGNEFDESEQLLVSCSVLLLDAPLGEKRKQGGSGRGVQ
jgi:hypothetical protein